MTEVEAWGLQPNDEVVMRRPGRRSRHGFVIRILPHDMTTERAMHYFNFNELDARKYSFDGPIIVVDMDGHQTLWAPPHVHRAPVEVRCACKSCNKVIVIMVPFLSYKAMQQGETNVNLEPDVRELLQSQLCGKCSKVVKR
jgi:hypothetical protein